MPRILTLSLNPTIDVSSVAERVQPTHKTRTEDETFDPGGGGVNVARVVRELGGDTEAWCLAGGVTGAFLDDLLDGLALPHRILPIAGNTRIALMVYERATGLEYRFVPSGPTLSHTEVADCLDALAAASFDYLVASGSLPKGAPDDMLARVGDIAAEKGARFVLDSSGPGLVATVGRTPVHLVKPSMNEFRALVGRPLDADAAGKAAIDMVAAGKADIIAVTMGIEGALVASRDGLLRLAAIPVETHSAVGSGDAFVGAMTFALASGMAIADAARLGIAAGAAAAMTHGTTLCHRDDVIRLYRQAGGTALPAVAAR